MEVLPMPPNKTPENTAQQGSWESGCEDATGHAEAHWGDEQADRTHASLFPRKSAHEAEEQPSMLPQGFPTENGNPNNTQR